MSGKSRSRKGKYSAQNKKGKGSPSLPTRLAQSSAAAQTHESGSSSGIPVAPARVPISMAKPVAISHPYVAAELRTIAILAGIIIIVLVVLALVLS